MLKSNINRKDKIIRFILGGIIMIAGILFRNVFGLIGLIPVTIALVGWCPIYKLLGINTYIPKNL